MAVVFPHRYRARRRGPVLAVVPAQIRPGTHLPPLQAGPRLDRPEDPRPGRRGPVDLADHRLPRPAPPRPPARRRPAPPLGTARPARTADPGPCPPRVPEHPREDRPARRCAETRQTRPGQAARVEEPPPGATPRRGKNDEKGAHAQSTARTSRLNDKLSARLSEEPSRCRRAGRPAVGSTRSRLA